MQIGDKCKVPVQDQRHFKNFQNDKMKRLPLVQKQKQVSICSFRYSRNSWHSFLLTPFDKDKFTFGACEQV